MSNFYDDLPIVDAHHHLWDLEGDLIYPWLANDEHAYMGDNSAVRRSFLPPEYRRDTALHNVIATVHVEAECDRRRQVEETAWLTRISLAHGMPNAIVAHAWIASPTARRSSSGRMHSRWCAASGRSRSSPRHQVTACVDSLAACRIRGGATA